MVVLAAEFLHQVATALSDATGEAVAGLQAIPIGGGDINAAFRLASAQRNYFLKINRVERLAMFEAEAAALHEIAATKTVRVPLPVCAGVSDGRSWLVLEWLDLHALDSETAGQLGRGLARLHSHGVAQFGWHRDNTIGTTPQPNAWNADWIEFWKTQRLGFQLRLAAQNGHGGRLQALGENLIDCCPALFRGHSPQASLLHGDLWGGNVACDATGEAVIYDPASYYGDREADLAMSELFGGFPSSFMRAYEEAWPVDEGYSLRRDFYNLYHLLNHLNLFGHGYLARSEAVMQRLLAELN